MVAVTPSTPGLRARREAVLGPAYRLFYTDPIEIVRGEGAWLWDADGRRYLDGYNNVASVGHANPVVVEAISRQAAVLNTHTRYLHAGVVEYAERLTAMMPAALDTVMFTCTGSEANDLALRLVIEATGRTGVIVTRTAYHGVTAAIAAISPSLGMGVGEHVRVIDPPRGVQSQDGLRFAVEVAAAATELASAGHPVAALIVDTVLSSDGLIPEPVGFLAEAARAVRAAGGVFIADEVQAGFGRTGHLWGFDRHGVEPDAVTLGKPMGNGHPLAGVVIRRDLAEPMASRTRYFNTFGGNPVSSAAGQAVLDVIERDGLVARAGERGAHLLDGLRAGVGNAAGVVDVRGVGLYAAVELDSGEWAGHIVDRMRAAGVLIAATGPGGRILKIRPPLIIDVDQVDLLVGTVVECLGG
jgi:4-aminobutyrate aminotransferase-like enzyme